MWGRGYSSSTHPQRLGTDRLAPCHRGVEERFQFTRAEAPCSSHRVGITSSLWTRERGKGTPAQQRGLGLGGGSLSPSLPSPLAHKPFRSNPGILHALEQLPCKGKRGAAPALRSLPTAPSPSPQLQEHGPTLHGKAPRDSAWGWVNRRSPFPLGFSFPAANWSIIHLVWQSPALGTQLCWDWRTCPPSPGGKGLMYSFVPG